MQALKNALRRFNEQPTQMNAMLLKMHSAPIQGMFEGANAAYRCLADSLNTELDSTTRERVVLMLNAFDAKYNPSGSEPFLPRMSEDFVQDVFNMLVEETYPDEWQELHARTFVELAFTYCIAGPLTLDKALQMFEALLRATAIFNPKVA